MTAADAMRAITFHIIRVHAVAAHAIAPNLPGEAK